MEFSEKTEIHAKLETQTGGPGIWQETLKNVENETHTLQDLDHGEKLTNTEKEKLAWQDIELGEKQ